MLVGSCRFSSKTVISVKKVEGEELNSADAQ